MGDRTTSCNRNCHNCHLNQYITCMDVQSEANCLDSEEEYFTGQHRCNSPKTVLVHNICQARKNIHTRPQPKCACVTERQKKVKKLCGCMKCLNTPYIMSPDCEYSRSVSNNPCNKMNKKKKKVSNKPKLHKITNLNPRCQNFHQSCQNSHRTSSHQSTKCHPDPCKDKYFCDFQTLFDTPCNSLKDIKSLLNQRKGVCSATPRRRLQQHCSCHSNPSLTLDQCSPKQQFIGFTEQQMLRLVTADGKLSPIGLIRSMCHHQSVDYKTCACHQPVDSVDSSCEECITVHYPQIPEEKSEEVVCTQGKKQNECRCSLDKVPPALVTFVNFPKCNVESKSNLICISPSGLKSKQILLHTTGEDDSDKKCLESERENVLKQPSLPKVTHVVEGREGEKSSECDTSHKPLPKEYNDCHQLSIQISIKNDEENSGIRPAIKCIVPNDKKSPQPEGPEIKSTKAVKADIPHFKTANSFLSTTKKPASDTFQRSEGIPMANNCQCLNLLGKIKSDQSSKDYKHFLQNYDSSPNKDAHLAQELSSMLSSPPSLVDLLDCVQSWWKRNRRPIAMQPSSTMGSSTQESVPKKLNNQFIRQDANQQVICNDTLQQKYQQDTAQKLFLSGRKEISQQNALLKVPVACECRKAPKPIPKEQKTQMKNIFLSRQREMERLARTKQSDYTQVENILPKYQSNYTQVENILPACRSDYTQAENILPPKQSDYTQMENILPSSRSNYTQVESTLPSRRNDYTQVENPLLSRRSDYTQVENTLPSRQNDYTQVEKIYSLGQNVCSQTENIFLPGKNDYSQTENVFPSRGNDYFPSGQNICSQTENVCPCNDDYPQIEKTFPSSPNDYSATVNISASGQEAYFQTENICPCYINPQMEMTEKKLRDVESIGSDVLVENYVEGVPAQEIEQQITSRMLQNVSWQDPEQGKESSYPSAKAKIPLASKEIQSSKKRRTKAITSTNEGRTINRQENKMRKQSPLKVDHRKLPEKISSPKLSSVAKKIKSPNSFTKNSGKSSQHSYKKATQQYKANKTKYKVNYFSENLQYRQRGKTDILDKKVSRPLKNTRNTQLPSLSLENHECYFPGPSNLQKPCSFTNKMNEKYCNFPLPLSLQCHQNSVPNSSCLTNTCNNDIDVKYPSSSESRCYNLFPVITNYPEQYLYSKKVDERNTNLPLTSSRYHQGSSSCISKLHSFKIDTQNTSFTSNIKTNLKTKHLNHSRTPTEWIPNSDDDQPLSGPEDSSLDSDIIQEGSSSKDEKVSNNSSSQDSLTDGYEEQGNMLSSVKKSEDSDEDQMGVSFPSLISKKTRTIPEGILHNIYGKTSSYTSVYKPEVTNIHSAKFHSNYFHSYPNQTLGKSLIEPIAILDAIKEDPSDMNYLSDFPSLLSGDPVWENVMLNNERLRDKEVSSDQNTLSNTVMKNNDNTIFTNTITSSPHYQHLSSTETSHIMQDKKNLPNMPLQSNEKTLPKDPEPLITGYPFTKSFAFDPSSHSGYMSGQNNIFVFPQLVQQGSNAGGRLMDNTFIAVPLSQYAQITLSGPNSISPDTTASGTQDPHVLPQNNTQTCPCNRTTPDQKIASTQISEIGRCNGPQPLDLQEISSGQTSIEGYNAPSAGLLKTASTQTSKLASLNVFQNIASTQTSVGMYDILRQTASTQTSTEKYNMPLTVPLEEPKHLQPSFPNCPCLSPFQDGAKKEPYSLSPKFTQTDLENEHISSVGPDTPVHQLSESFVSQSNKHPSDTISPTVSYPIEQMHTASVNDSEHFLKEHNLSSPNSLKGSYNGSAHQEYSERKVEIEQNEDLGSCCVEDLSILSIGSSPVCVCHLQNGSILSNKNLYFCCLENGSIMSTESSPIRKQDGSIIGVKRSPKSTSPLQKSSIVRAESLPISVCCLENGSIVSTDSSPIHLRDGGIVSVKSSPTSTSHSQKDSIARAESPPVSICCLENGSVVSTGSSPIHLQDGGIISVKSSPKSTSHSQKNSIMSAKSPLVSICCLENGSIVSAESVPVQNVSVVNAESTQLLVPCFCLRKDSIVSTKSLPVSICCLEDGSIMSAESSPIHLQNNGKITINSSPESKNYSRKGDIVSPKSSPVSIRCLNNDSMVNARSLPQSTGLVTSKSSPVYICCLENGSIMSNESTPVSAYQQQNTKAVADENLPAVHHSNLQSKQVDKKPSSCCCEDTYSTSGENSTIFAPKYFKTCHEKNTQKDLYSPHHSSSNVGSAAEFVPQTSLDSGAKQEKLNVFIALHRPLTDQSEEKNVYNGISSLMSPFQPTLTKGAQVISKQKTVGSNIDNDLTSSKRLPLNSPSPSLTQRHPIQVEYQPTTIVKHDEQQLDHKLRTQFKNIMPSLREYNYLVAPHRSQFSNTEAQADQNISFTPYLVRKDVNLQTSVAPQTDKGLHMGPDTNESDLQDGRSFLLNSGNELMLNNICLGNEGVFSVASSVGSFTPKCSFLHEDGRVNDIHSLCDENIPMTHSMKFTTSADSRQFFSQSVQTSSLGNSNLQTAKSACIQTESKIPINEHLNAGPLPCVGIDLLIPSEKSLPHMGTSCMIPTSTPISERNPVTPQCLSKVKFSEQLDTTSNQMSSLANASGQKTLLGKNHTVDPSQSFKSTQFPSIEHTSKTKPSLANALQTHILNLDSSLSGTYCKKQLIKDPCFKKQRKSTSVNFLQTVNSVNPNKAQKSVQRNPPSELGIPHEDDRGTVSSLDRNLGCIFQENTRKMQRNSVNSVELLCMALDTCSQVMSNQSSSSVAQIPFLTRSSVYEPVPTDTSFRPIESTRRNNWYEKCKKTCRIQPELLGENAHASRQFPFTATNSSSNPSSLHQEPCNVTSNVSDTMQQTDSISDSTDKTNLKDVPSKLSKQGPMRSKMRSNKPYPYKVKRDKTLASQKMSPFKLLCMPITSQPVNAQRSPYMSAQAAITVRPQKELVISQITHKKHK